MKITISIEHPDHDEPIELPARWVICGQCDGHGMSSAYLGAFTREDIEDQGPEFMEEYMNGGYDRPCETCKGTGKIRIIDEDRCTSELERKGLAHHLESQAIEAESEAERRAEMRMMGYEV